MLEKVMWKPPVPPAKDVSSNGQQFASFASTASQSKAEGIARSLAAGKSIDQIVKEHPGLTRQQVIAQLRAAGYEVKVTEPQAGETRVTQVRDPKNGKTVTEYTDFQHGTYYTSVKAQGGQEVSTPVRDGLGRKVTSQRDPATGAITTRYEDDLNLSSGTTIETTRLADGTVVTTTKQRGGVTETEVAGPDGQRTKLANDQQPTREGTQPILKKIAGGKSIDQIVKEHPGLTRQQVIAQLRAAGYEVTVAEPQAGETRVTQVRDPKTGKTVTEYSDFQHGTYYTSVKAPGGEEVSTPVRDGLGRKVTSHRDPSTGAITTRYEDDLNNGKVVATTRFADGTLVTKTTQRDGVTETEVTSPDGRRTKLANDQQPTREGAQPILRKIADGKTIDEIVKEHPGWTREQAIAQLRAAGYEVKETSNGTSGTTEVRNPHTGKVVASYSGNGHDGPYSSQFVDGDGNTITTTRDPQGTTTRTVVEPNGRQTTTTTREVDGKTQKSTKVTFNGYTLTTGPDGRLTLTDEGGNEVKIKPGTMLEGLARTLMAVNPNSSDPAERKEGQIIKTFIEGVFAGERLPELITKAQGLGEETQRMLAKYGAGHVAKPIRDKDKNIIDPLGLPPAGNAPSGGKWVPVKIQGQWKWVDPKVAQAMAAENVALSRVAETRAKVHRSQAQFDVHALDPAYKGALADARRTINKALAPYGLQWTPPKPKGTLEEARQRLAGADTMLKNASGARSEYEQAARILNDAITLLSSLSVPLVAAPVTGPQVRATGVNHALRDAQNEQARTRAVSLFSEVGLHMSKGDKLSLDYLVGLGEQNLTANKGTPQYKELEAALGDLKEMQTAAGQQLELAEAYNNFYLARGDASAMRVLGQKLLTEYNSKNQFLFEPNKEHKTYGGKYLGTFTGQEIEVRDGQAWVVNHFEKGTTEQQLTYALDDKNVRGEYRDRALNKEWQAAQKPDPSVCQLDPLQAELQAGKNLNEALKQQIDGKIKLLDGTIRDLQTRYDGALKEHGPGSVEAPAGTLPQGTQPVEIDVGGRKIKVAPEVAPKYEKSGLEALVKSGKPVWIEIEVQRDDGSRGTEGRWVDPDLAVLRLQLSAAQTQRQGVSDLRSEVEGYSAWYSLRQQEPAPLVGTDPGLDKASLDHHQQLTLDAIYQPQYQAMLRSAQNGKSNDFEFRRVEDSTLDATVSRMLGLGSSSEGREALKEATREIRGIGDEVDVRAVPLFHVDETGGSQQIALIAVKGDDGKTWYIDATGMKFENLNDFQDNNRQFGENGKLVVPAGLEMKAGADGKIALDVVKARNVSIHEKIIDPVVGLVGTVATVASFSGVLAPVAAPVALASGVYLGGRAAYMQKQYLSHGGEWSDGESLMNMGMMATVTLPVGSSTLRTIGMAGKPLASGTRMSLWNASRASIGAVSANSELATAAAGTYMRSTTTLNRVARGMDWGAIGVGVPLMAASAHNLFLYGDQMSGLQLADALTGLGVGAVGTGMGVRNLRATKPQQTQPSAPLPRAGTIELVDETGQTITARHLGAPPKNLDDILLPEPDGTQPRGDDPRHQSKTHILVRDPDTGEAFVVPYVRGASSEHTPNPAGEPDPSADPSGETNPKQNQPEQPAPEASSPKPAETSPTEKEGPPPLNVKRAAFYILAARSLAAAFGHLTGITAAYNAMSGQGASTAAYYRSALSKLAWYTHNHGMIDVFELAAKGEVDKAMARLNKIIDRAQKRGAAPLNEEESADLRALVQRVGNQGAAYRAALETLDPAMRDTLPTVKIRDLPVPEEIIKNWLPENLESLPEINRILTAMSEQPGGVYSGKTPAEILADLSRKFDLLTDIDGEGPLRNRLLATKEARDAYRALYRTLKEALPSGSDPQRIDHKAAEKKPGSSMAPDTWRGYLFKLGSFGGAFNVLLAWGSKGMPSHGGSFLQTFVDWGGYMADPAGVVPATIVQWKYLKALRELSDYKADHPYPRTSEQEEQLAILEARRKRLNTLADYTSIASGIRNILVGAQYLMAGNYPLALGSFLQAGSSFGWVLVQQTPKSMKIAPGTKKAIRYSSISLGILVPTAIMLWKMLAEEEQKQQGPSMYGLATESYRDLSQAVESWGKALGLDELLGERPSDLAFAKAMQQMVNMPFDPSLMPGQNGYPDLRSMALAGAGDPTWPFGIEGRGNPRLEREGFAPVLAEEGDTISRIARAHAADVAATVVLNMDHIADPSLIFPGDRIYLPA